MNTRGLAGEFPPGTCSAIQNAADLVCGCYDPCSICAEGSSGFGMQGQPANPEAMIKLRDELVTCADAYAQGQAGNIASDVCDATQKSALEVCGCYEACNVCGDDGREITTPDGFFALGENAETVISCTDAQNEGALNNMSPEMCSAVQDAAEDACCATPSPTEAPTERIEPACNICVDGAVGNQNADIIIGDGGDGVRVTCSRAMELGMAGQFTPNTCTAFQAAADDVCGCHQTCNICGSSGAFGMQGQPSNPEAPFTYGNVQTTCGEAQEQGELGNISPEQCEDVQDAALSQCGCYESCDVCGTDGTFDRPYGELVVGGEDTKCSVVAEKGLDGNLSPEVCEDATEAARSACCTFPTPEPTPMPTVEPTKAPTAPPTPVPTERIEPACPVCSNNADPARPGQVIMVEAERGVMTLRCDEAQEFGQAGEFAPSTCRAVQAAAAADNACGCFPTASPTPAPEPPCDVCANGAEPGNPEETIVFLLDGTDVELTCASAPALWK